MHAQSTTFAVPQTIADVIALYLASSDAKSLDSFKSRKAVLDDFARHCGAVPLAEAKPYIAQTWLDSKETWQSNWTRKRAIAGVHRAMNWAHRLGIVQSNPFKGVTVGMGERGQPMEEAEFAAIIRNSPPWFRRLAIGLRFSGARPGELAKATLADVDDERACIELRKHKTAKKVGHARRIILHPVLQRYVAWRRRQPWPCDLLFPNSRLRKWTNPAICYRLRRARWLAEGAIRKETSLYGMRHGWACRAILKGVGLPVVAEMMGHTRVTTTMGYVHMAKETTHLQAELTRMFKRAA